MTDHWSVLGGLIYDIENEATVTHSLGLAYGDECFEISAVYSETPEPYSDLVADRQLFFRVSLRTLASTEFSCCAHIEGPIRRVHRWHGRKHSTEQWRCIQVSP